MLSVKQILVSLFSPMSVCLGLVVVGLVLLVFSQKKQKMGKLFVFLGIVEGVTGGMGAFSIRSD